MKNISKELFNIKHKKKQWHWQLKNLDDEKILMCYLCNETFDFKDRNYRKVKDNCHFTGTFRDAVHSICSVLVFNTRRNSSNGND